MWVMISGCHTLNIFWKLLIIKNKLSISVKNVLYVLKLNSWFDFMFARPGYLFLNLRTYKFWGKNGTEIKILCVAAKAEKPAFYSLKFKISYPAVLRSCGLGNNFINYRSIMKMNSVSLRTKCSIKYSEHTRQQQRNQWFIFRSEHI